MEDSLPQKQSSESKIEGISKMERHQLGKTDLFVTRLCWGPNAFGRWTSTEQAKNTALAAFDGVEKGFVNFIDTANNYGDSEYRIGEALKVRGGLPLDCILATKADRDPTTNEFTASRIRQSVEESLQRLGVKKLPLVYLHDPEYHPRYSTDRKGVVKEILGSDGALAELEKLREKGVIQHIGISGGPIDLLIEFVETGRFDVVITHNRWNLIYQTAEPLFIAAQKKTMGIVNAAPFGSGLLVDEDGLRRFSYKSPSEEITKRFEKIKEACKRYNIPIAAAALQFSFRDRRINSTIVGIADPKQIEENLRLLKIPIPDQLWSELKEFAIKEGDPEGH